MEDRIHTIHGHVRVDPARVVAGKHCCHDDCVYCFDEGVSVVIAKVVVLVASRPAHARVSMMIVISNVLMGATAA